MSKFCARGRRIEPSRETSAGHVCGRPKCLVEEVGQRLAAIALAAHVLEREGANPEAIRTIRTALDEARLELIAACTEGAQGPGA